MQLLCSSVCSYYCRGNLDGKGQSQSLCFWQTVTCAIVLWFCLSNLHVSRKNFLIAHENYRAEVNALNFGVKTQKVTVQGHSGITYAGNITVQAEAYSTQHLL